MVGAQASLERGWKEAERMALIWAPLGTSRLSPHLILLVKPVTRSVQVESSRNKLYLPLEGLEKMRWHPYFVHHVRLALPSWVLLGTLGLRSPFWESISLNVLLSSSCLALSLSCGLNV